MANALSNHCTVAWVTRPERPKGVKHVIKQAQRAQVGAPSSKRIMMKVNDKRNGGVKVTGKRGDNQKLLTLSEFSLQ